MKKKFTALCSVFVAISVCCAVFTVKTDNLKTDVSTATAKTYYAENSEDTTSTSGSLGSILGDVVGGIGSDSSGSIGDIMGGIGSDSFDGIGDVIGGFGDALGGIGDVFGGLLGGLGSSSESTVAPPTTSYDTGLIVPVPAATQTFGTTEFTVTPTIPETESQGETVDFAATSNPYTKPTQNFVAGAEDDTIKWLQWIFIYTHYGLADDGITGVLDEDTVAVIKKLQHEYGLTVDGNMTAEVIQKAELLYYQWALGADATAVEVSLETSVSEPLTSVAADTQGDNRSTVVMLIIVLVLIWILAIGGIFLMFFMKKRKLAKVSLNKEESKQTSSQETEEKKEVNNTGISSLSDLFEDANKE